MLLTVIADYVGMREDKAVASLGGRVYSANPLVLMILSTFANGYFSFCPY